MRNTRVVLTFGIAAVVVFAAGCSGNSSLGSIAMTPTETHSIVRNARPDIPLSTLLGRGSYDVTPYHGKNWAAPIQGAIIIYACEFSGGYCNWYNKGYDVVAGTVTAGQVWGICIDMHGNVYIPDAQSRHILEYQKGGITPIADFDDTSQNFPAFCAVDRRGNVYVANRENHSISVFAPGATTPTRIIKTHTYMAFIEGIAIDEHGLLAVSWSYGQSVDEFPNARGPGVTVLTIPSGPGIGAVAFDKAENLVITTASPQAFVFDGASFGLCNTIPQPPKSQELGVSISKRNGEMYVSDAAKEAVYEETFGDCTGGGTIVKKYDAGLEAGQPVLGIAVDPGEQQ